MSSAENRLILLFICIFIFYFERVSCKCSGYGMKKFSNS